jgi:hypothetical protein
MNDKSTTPSTDRRLSRWATRGLAGLILATSIAGGGAGVASAAEPAAPQPTATVSPAQVKGSSSITMIITNNTDQTLTLQSSDYGYGHWQKRPTDLAPYASETVSGYSNNINGSALYVLYSLPNGQNVQFSAAVPLDGHDSEQAITTGDGYHATESPISGYHPTVAMAVSPSA